MRKQSLVRLGISYMMIVCIAGGITACDSDKVDENIIAENTNIIEAELSTEVLEEVTEILEESTSVSGSMTEAETPTIESDDFIVEEMDATMYAVDTVSLREGPSETDFKENTMILKGEAVAVIGKVTAYKGVECLWYQLNTGEFVSSEYLTDTQPVEETTESTNIDTTTESESPLADFTDEELQNIFNEAVGGSPNNETKTTTEDGRPFATGNPDWVGGGEATTDYDWGGSETKTTTEDGRPFAENIGGDGIVDPWQ